MEKLGDCGCGGLTSENESAGCGSALLPTQNASHHHYLSVDPRGDCPRWHHPETAERVMHRIWCGSLLRIMCVLPLNQCIKVVFIMASIKTTLCVFSQKCEFSLGVDY